MDMYKQRCNIDMKSSLNILGSFIVYVFWYLTTIEKKGYISCWTYYLCNETYGMELIKNRDRSYSL